MWNTGQLQTRADIPSNVLPNERALETMNRSDCEAQDLAFTWVSFVFYILIREM
jgi:hypothetical protein